MEPETDTQALDAADCKRGLRGGCLRHQRLELVLSFLLAPKVFDWKYPLELVSVPDYAINSLEIRLLESAVESLSPLQDLCLYLPLLLHSKLA